MNKIHKLTGIALQNFPAIGIFFGAIVGYGIHYFGDTRILFSHRNITIPILVVLMFSGNFAARFFYSIETFEKYMKNHAPGFKSWRLSPLEPIFYPTMVSNIGIFRKIAGYVYVLSHILSLTFMMTAVFASFFNMLFR